MRNVIRAALISVLLVMGGEPAEAGAFEDALAAAQRGDYPTALRLWQPLAEQGHANAQYNLGVMYDKIPRPPFSLLCTVDFRPYVRSRTG